MNKVRGGETFKMWNENTENLHLTHSSPSSPSDIKWETVLRAKMHIERLPKSQTRLTQGLMVNK